MRAIAALLAIAAAACLGSAAWLWAKTHHFFHSNEYAPNSARMPSYTAGNVEADGTGIFLPSVLILALGLFLAKFSWNMWQGDRHQKEATGSKNREATRAEKNSDLHK